MNRQVKILVSGRVQGVFFRASAQKQALQLGVTGTAKNLPDGRVEVVACGDSEAVERMIRWCRQGPAAARVEQVVIETLQLATAPVGFVVR
ncbi:MAG: acylphosphatase [Gammaproteobacteria bacterium]